MTEKLILFSFAGILGTLVFHLVLGLVLSSFFSTSYFVLTYWYVPHIFLPALLLLVFAWWLGFFRPRSSRWADLGLLLLTGFIVLGTVGAPYNCLNEICF